MQLLCFIQSAGLFADGAT